jgi:hypothetical protein
MLKKVVRETRQTSSETLTREFRSVMNCPSSTLTVRRELRGMGLHGVYEDYIFLDITPCSPLKVTDVSEEYIAFIFKVE